MPVSFFTPSTYATVPQANLATSLIPPLAQGLFKAAQTYQAGKAVDQAATEASTLFRDPAIGNIFRQMGASALAQGQDPTPVINSMLSTAITLKRDEDQMAQRERFQMRGFGQQMALENLRTSNNLAEIQARSDAIATRDAEAGFRTYEETIMKKKAEADFLKSAEGQAVQEVEDERAANEARQAGAMAYQREYGKNLAREDMGLPTDGGSSAMDDLFADSGINPNEPLTGKTKEELDSMESEILTLGERSEEARRQLAPRLRSIREAKETAPRKRKESSGSTAVPSRYFTP